MGSDNYGDKIWVICTLGTNFCGELINWNYQDRLRLVDVDLNQSYISVHQALQRVWHSQFLRWDFLVLAPKVMPKRHTIGCELGQGYLTAFMIISAITRQDIWSSRAAATSGASRSLVLEIARDLGEPALEAYSSEIRTVFERIILCANHLPEWAQLERKEDFDESLRQWGSKMPFGGMLHLFFYTENGRVEEIIATVAKDLTPLTLRLRGKSPVFVAEDYLLVPTDQFDPGQCHRCFQAGMQFLLLGCSSSGISVGFSDCAKSSFRLKIESTVLQVDALWCCDEEWYFWSRIPYSTTRAISYRGPSLVLSAFTESDGVKSLSAYYALGLMSDIQSGIILQATTSFITIHSFSCPWITFGGGSFVGEMTNLRKDGCEITRYG
ncbi:hypothetical protein F5146DRAFT_1118236 [Armillaria mellea]|nr:hypothetical protein F5146DRAFT_1118236 [Armillaria mellea]